MGQPKSIRSSIMDPLLNFKFIVSWGPSDGNLKVVAGVSKIGALKRSTEAVAHREGAAPFVTRQIPGQTKYDDISLERGLICDVEFEQWANKIWFYEQTEALGNQVSLKDFRKTLKIDLMNQAGQIMMVYYVFNCWPKEYTALPELDAQAAGTVALESMTLAHEGWTRDTSFEAPAYPDGYTSFALPESPNIEGVAPPA